MIAWFGSKTIYTIVINPFHGPSTQFTKSLIGRQILKLSMRIPKQTVGAIVQAVLYRILSARPLCVN
jgi:hypothetical protein